MNKKGIKKILFIFLLVIGIFFINSEVVKAADQVICEYAGEWGTVEIHKDWEYVDQVTGNGGTKDVYWFNHTVPSDNCTNGAKCYEKINFTSAAKVVDGQCPRMYYRIKKEKTYTTIDPTTDQPYEYTEVLLEFSDQDIGTEAPLTKGTLYLSDTEKTCNSLKSQLNSIRSKYQGGNSTSSSSIVSRVNALEKSAVNLKGQPELYESLKNEVETLTSLLSDIKINHYNKIDTVKLNNNCDEAGKSLYKTVGNEIETLARRVASYGYTIENTLSNNCRKEMDATLKEKWCNLEDDYEELMVNVKRQRENMIGSGNGAMDCDGILGENVKADIKEVLTYIRIVVPILVIILGIVDFSKVVLGGDEKEMSKAISNLVKRLIAAVAIFFAPIIIMMVINLVDSLAGGCDIRGW